jgi:hypothetical protein
MLRDRELMRGPRSSLPVTKACASTRVYGLGIDGIQWRISGSWQAR